MPLGLQCPVCNNENTLYIKVLYDSGTVRGNSTSYTTGENIIRIPLTIKHYTID